MTGVEVLQEAIDQAQFAFLEASLLPHGKIAVALLTIYEGAKAEDSNLWRNRRLAETVLKHEDKAFACLLEHNYLRSGK